MSRFSVTVQELTGGQCTYVARVRVEFEQDAESRAVIRLFGRRAFWRPDCEMDPNGTCGFVFENVRQNDGWSATRRTSLARITITPGWPQIDHPVLPAGGSAESPPL